MFGCEVDMGSGNTRGLGLSLVFYTLKVLCGSFKSQKFIILILSVRTVTLCGEVDMSSSEY